MKIIEIAIGIFAVACYLWFGCFVGREFGSYENFIMHIIENIKKRGSDG